ncbi:MAG: AAA family ATPase [bacterium]|nr:AAA family ATPase [bacterium]
MKTSKKSHVSWKVIGHGKILEFLEMAIVDNTLTSAYLFHGPAKVGKSTVAKQFINAVLCEQTDAPCGSCNGCKSFLNKNHPDVVWVEKSLEQKNIGIDQIREQVIHRHHLRPSFAQYQITVIDQAETLSLEAANSLLKTLEEPSAESIIIIIADSPERLPKTIVSRCQRIEFFTVTTDAIRDFVVAESDTAISKGVIEDISHSANGRPGIAWRFIHVPEEWKTYQDDVLSFVEVINAPLSARFRFVQDLLSAKSFQENVSVAMNALKLWQTVLRSLLLGGYGVESQRLRALDKLSGKKLQFSRGDLASWLGEAYRLRRGLEANLSPKLAVEHFLLLFPSS